MFDTTYRNVFFYSEKNHVGRIVLHVDMDSFFASVEVREHPEAKFEGDVGVLQRRHLKPKGCVYIGKEANKFEMQELEGNRIETYIDFKKFHEWVLGFRAKRCARNGN